MGTIEEVGEWAESLDHAMRAESLEHAMKT